MADQEKVTLALRDAVSLWRISPGTSTPDVIDAATDCLVAGVDTPSLCVLAGESPRESQFVLEPLIVATVHELGKPEWLEANIQTAALAAMLRRLTRGGLTPRELASWAHTHIGHDGGDDCAPFVELDDLYDEVSYLGYNESELDQMLWREADDFLSGRPSSWFEIDPLRRGARILEPTTPPRWRRWLAVLTGRVPRQR